MNDANKNIAIAKKTFASTLPPLSFHEKLFYKFVIL